MLRILGRAALTLAVVASGITIAAPARAVEPLVVDVFCEPLGRYRVLCEGTVTGGTPPYTRNWFYNDRYFPTQDNKTFTSWSCSTGIVNRYTMAVTDSEFQIAFDAGGSGRQSGNP